ncbi:Gfo/Idh/MocA family protein [Actinacidiphila bryophytorum]|uniref:Gfo/Idh/MocA family protein n=1 Tax=Actinacidiphila bryophytorum TaxID=1436133 RepID=UPI002176EA1E|nr:Gfo/Idh/MocA family oxidoreductase [Actinacidiphila bryophytorum]UWE10069.1 Gfo/Idh/MocA family oxidoreductase [Actinacidiphila bryophytorum]
MGRLRIGVLGCADIAVRRMLPAMAASARVELVALASRRPERAAEVAGQYGCRAVSGYAALLRDPEVQAVYVPLPAALHAEWVERSLRAGKHVLAEKPLTTRYEQTAALLGLARSCGKVLMENVMFVHHPQHSAVRRLLDSGVIGELRFFRAEFTVPRRPAGDIRHEPQLGGGALWDTAVYPVRAALHLLGHDLAVVAAVLSRGGQDRVDTAGAALLRTADGVSAQLAFGLDHGYRSVYELCGSEGRITVEHAFTPPADHCPVLRLEGRYGSEDVVLKAADQVALALDGFAAAVRAGSGPADVYRRQAAVLDEVLTAATAQRRRSD